VNDDGGLMQHANVFDMKCVQEAKQHFIDEQRVNKDATET